MSIVATFFRQAAHLTKVAVLSSSFSLPPPTLLISSSPPPHNHMHSSSLPPSQEEVDVKRTLEPQLHYHQEDEEKQDGDSTGDSTTAVSSLSSMSNRTCMSQDYCTVYMSYTWSAPCRSILIRAHKGTICFTQLDFACTFSAM